MKKINLFLMGIAVFSSFVFVSCNKEAEKNSHATGSAIRNLGRHDFREWTKSG